MQLKVVQRLLGLLLMVYSGTLIPPMAVSLYYGDGALPAFAYGLGLTVLIGFLIWLPARRHNAELRLRDGFLVVAAFWFGLGSISALPLLFIEAPALSFTDAMFEAMSGLTTTGATVLTGLDHMAPSVLYYRQQLNWLGGMGIIILAVAVLPMLGVGGMQLYRAEIVGPVKDTKLTPRITETAKALWFIYVGLTVVCAGAYFAAGMSLFDAIGHSFSTVAIGGFSTHDASIGYFDSPLINSIAIVFMILAGANFGLHFIAWRGKSLGAYMRDSEFRAYIKGLAGLSVAVVGYLLVSDQYTSVGQTFNQGLFQVVSIATTTGFTTTEFAAWPGALPVLLIFASFVGGCAGSTGGGMKVMRCLLLYRQGLREIKQLVHPNAEIPVKMGGRAVPARVIESVWGFFAVYVFIFALMMIMLLFDGLDQVTAFSAVAASLNNLGPGLGEVANGFGGLSDISKWVCMLAMLLGRLEIFTVLVLFTRTFWEQ